MKWKIYALKGIQYSVYYYIITENTLVLEILFDKKQTQPYIKKRKIKKEKKSSIFKKVRSIYEYQELYMFFAFSMIEFLFSETYQDFIYRKVITKQNNIHVWVGMPR